MRFAFAGTPEFAAWVLRDLAELGRRPALVITQPDRPRGRGCRTSAPPAAQEAGRLGIDCLQTEDINSGDVLLRLRSDRIPTLVVAAFGQMLRSSLLDSLLCLNIHGSLLPSYRGPAPIQRALAAGETRIGMSVMRITEPLDEGPWAIQKSVSIDLHDDAGSVGRTLALMGAAGVDQALDGLTDGTIRWNEQEGPASYAPKLTAVDSILNPDRSARNVHDQVRSLSPSIGARTSSGEVSFKVWRTWPLGEAGLAPIPACAHDMAGSPGRVGQVGQRLFVGCAAGVIEILAIQPAGKKSMTAAEFLRGYRGRLGECLEPVTGGDPGTGACEPEEKRP